MLVSGLYYSREGCCRYLNLRGASHHTTEADPSGELRVQDPAPYFLVRRGGICTQELVFSLFVDSGKGQGRCILAATRYQHTVTGHGGNMALTLWGTCRPAQRDMTSSAVFYFPNYAEVRNTNDATAAANVIGVGRSLHYTL